MAIDIRKQLKKVLPHLVRAKDQNLNEADTCMCICEVFEQALGYNPLEHISREVQIRDGYADFGVKLDGVIQFLVEAKSAGSELKDSHIAQAERYASQANIRWVVLTNGVTWHLYHLSFEEGIRAERLFAVDLIGEDFDEAASQLGFLHRRSVQKGDLEELWNLKSALTPESIAKSLFLEDVLRKIRRDIRSREDILVSEEELGKAIHEMLSIEARERIGPFRIRRKRRVRDKETEVTAEQTSTGCANT